MCNNKQWGEWQQFFSVPRKIIDCRNCNSAIIVHLALCATSRYSFSDIFFSGKLSETGKINYIYSVDGGVGVGHTPLCCPPHLGLRWAAIQRARHPGQPVVNLCKQSWPVGQDTGFLPPPAAKWPPALRPQPGEGPCGNGCAHIRTRESGCFCVFFISSFHLWGYQQGSAAESHKLKAVSKAVLPPAQPMVGKEKSPWTGVFCDLAAIPV